MRPPLFFRLLIVFLAPKADRDAILGDLEEEFHQRTINSSAIVAYLWYTKQFFGSLGHWIFTKDQLGAILLAVVCLSAYSLAFCWEYWISTLAISG